MDRAKSGLKSASFKVSAVIIIASRKGSAWNLSMAVARGIMLFMDLLIFWPSIRTLPLT